MTAAARGDLDAVEKMLEGGLDPNGAGKYYTPLAMAAAGGHTEVLNALLGAGARLDARDPAGASAGYTALVWAAKGGRVATIDLLIERGADLRLSSENGLTALMAAAVWGGPAATRRLVDAGGKVNERSSEGNTALIWACLGSPTKPSDQAETARILLSAGADANVVNGQGWTALSYCAWEGNPEVAAVLLGAGAKPRSGAESEADLARRAEHEDVAEMIESQAPPSGNGSGVTDLGPHGASRASGGAMTAAGVAVFLFSFFVLRGGALGGLLSIAGIVLFVWGLVLIAKSRATVSVPSPETSLLASIADLKNEIQAWGPPYPAAKMRTLGEKYAMLYDVTGKQSHRASALKYLNAAYEIEPAMFDRQPRGRRRSFGSLEADPEFSRFVGRTDVRSSLG